MRATGLSRAWPAPTGVLYPAELVAQPVHNRIGHWPSKPGVAGSSPAGRARIFVGGRHAGDRFVAGMARSHRIWL